MIDKEKRIQQAIGYFESGYNCSQAVFMAFADCYQMDTDTAARLTSSFGGGMGRLREVCGAVSAMFLTLGLHYPANDPTNKAARKQNYEAVQRVAFAFKQEMGSYICADLLQLRREAQDPAPSERTDRYYQQRPCTRCVALAAEILANEIM